MSFLRYAWALQALTVCRFCTDQVIVYKLYVVDVDG